MFKVVTRPRAAANILLAYTEQGSNKVKYQWIAPADYSFPYVTATMFFQPLPNRTYYLHLYSTTEPGFPGTSPLNPDLSQIQNDMWQGIAFATPQADLQVFTMYPDAQYSASNNQVKFK